VQAGYRAVLKSISDIPMTTIEPPSTSTRGHSRAGSQSSIAENSFTTVPLNYAPMTPSQRLKRNSEDSSLSEDERQPKRRAK
jgi:hypothetical protein